MTICFGRFDSEISDLKKTHTNLHVVSIKILLRLLLHAKIIKINRIRMYTIIYIEIEKKILHEAPMV